jgi:hypothetical protein
MFRDSMRPLGIVVLAVLATAPVVRTLCVWACEATTAPAVAAGEHAGHCTPPSEAGNGDGAGLASLAGCESCDVLGEALRATVRSEHSLTVGLPAPELAVAHAASPSSQPATLPAHAPSPPLRAPYPLRI